MPKDVQAGDDRAVDTTEPALPQPDESSQILVNIDRVAYAYPNGLQAIKDMTVQVARGRTVALVGPSGCGKSTLLRILGGLEQPTGGAVETRFVSAKGRQTVSMVFQEDTLLPWLTVRANVALFFRLRKHDRSKRDVTLRVDELLAMVGLTQFADAYPKQLSGGMKRRVAFLASIAAKPELLLLDEPFSSLDEPTRVQIHQQVRSIVEQSRLTTILVTHDLAEAIALSDEILILSARPARVVARYEVTLERGRDMLALRNHADFLRLYGELWGSLSEQIRVANEEVEAVAQ